MKHNITRRYLKKNGGKFDFSKYTMEEIKSNMKNCKPSPPKMWTKKNTKTGQNAKCEQIIIPKIIINEPSEEAIIPQPISIYESPNVISNERYDYIKEKYGHMSSWAIWSKQNGKTKSGMEDISFFYNPSKKTLETLNPNIILVGLNISEKIDRVFGNFHPDKTKAQDYKTRYALQDTMFWGAYMTDIIKSFEEKISGNLMKYLSKNKRFEKENIEKFEQELVDIGSHNPIIIALGNDSYKILKRNLPKNKVYKVSHYSAYITKEKLRTEFEKLEKDIKE